MRSVLLPVFALVAEATLAQCTSTGNTNGSSFSNNTSIGTVAWNTPSNAQLSDDVRSSGSVSISLLSSATTNYLVVTGFGFSIPPTATICGIQVDVEKSYSLILGLLSSVSDNSVKIVKGGTISGNNKAAGGGWPASDAYVSYGNSSDFWGLTWLPSDINASNFGVAISATISSGLAALTLNTLIDHIRINVYFNSSLPITFKDFQAKPLPGKIKLKWSTVSESNSHYFIPEKFIINTNNWIALDTVMAAVNSSAEKFYESYDIAPGSNNIYRIKEIDLNGNVFYSKTISARYKRPEEGLTTIYPNPAHDFVNVSSTKPILALTVCDLTGKKLMSIKTSGLSKNLQIPAKQLKTGVYYLIVETNGNRLTRKLVIEN